ncbi:MAG: alcohol dehydrogenase catalytic domain-containing protein [Planctomycetota bacterium]
MSLPETMQVLQLRRPGGLERVELPVPLPRPGEILIRTTAAVICTSDLNDMNHNPFGITLPRVLGHEASGIVAALGEDAGRFAIGERVVPHPVIPCLACDNCRRGLGHLCERMGHLGVDRDGTFAEYFRIRADRVRRVPAGMDPAAAALMEPVAVCLEALERARIGAGDSVLVIGDGPFGVILARLALRSNPGRVVFAGHHPFRLGLAPAATCIDAHRTPDVAGAVREATHGRGVDAAILAVGREDAVDLGIRSLRARGRLVIFSAIAPPPRVDLFQVHVRELELLGACNDRDFLDAGLACLADPALELGSLVTHRVPFADWPRALDLAARGKDRALKVAIMFGEDHP